MPEETKTFEQIASGVLDQQVPNDAANAGAGNAQETASTSTETGSHVPDGQNAEVTPSLRDRLAELSFQFGDQDDDSVAQERLFAAFVDLQNKQKELQQQNEWMRLQQLYAPQEQPATPAQPAAGTTETSWWNPPTVDEGLLRQFLVTNEAGETELAAETPLQLRAAFEARKAYRNDFVNRFLENPETALSPMLERQSHSIRQMIQEALQSMQEEQRVQSVVKDFVTQNESWLYQIDPITQQPKRQGDQPLLSEAGHNFNSIYTSLLDRGLDEATALQAANGLYQQRFGNREAVKQQIAANRVQHVLNGSANAASRNGHQAAVAAGTLTGQAAKTNESFENIFWRNFTANGGGA